MNDLLGFFGWCFVLWLFCGGYKKLSDYNDELKARVGKHVVLQKDTLIIMDYSLINSNYTLSNNTQISADLAKTLPIAQPQ